MVITNPAVILIAPSTKIGTENPRSSGFGLIIYPPRINPQAIPIK
jgi:hypothetical protein